MMKHLLLLLSLTIVGTSFAQESLYSQSDLKSIRKIEDKGSCLAFEATFSKPLVVPPLAVVDVDRQDFLGDDGLISTILDVISLSPRKYRLEVKDPKACESAKEKGSNVYVTVTDGVGSDLKEILPSAKTF